MISRYYETFRCEPFLPIIVSLYIFLVKNMSQKIINLNQNTLNLKIT